MGQLWRGRTRILRRGRRGLKTGFEGPVRVSFTERLGYTELNSPPTSDGTTRTVFNRGSARCISGPAIEGAQWIVIVTDLYT